MLLTTQRMDPLQSSIMKMFTGSGCGDKQRFKDRESDLSLAGDLKC